MCCSRCDLQTWGSMLGARGWMTSWTGSDVDDGGAFLFWRPLPGGRGITAVAEAGYKPWLSASWYSAACLASASFFPTTNLGSGRSLTGETGIRSWGLVEGFSKLDFPGANSLPAAQRFAMWPISLILPRVSASVIYCPHSPECLE